jgi:hypothetical protein
VKLSAEIPTKHLEELSPLMDADFSLAHLILEDKIYAEFYLQQAKAGRMVIMDNSMHELPASLSVGEILEAADRTKPSFVIPPDKLGDVKFTYDQFEILRKQNLRHGHRLAAVLCGSNSAERSMFFTNVRAYIDMICFPYREPRLTWFDELLTAIPKHAGWPPYIHLLGVNTLDELSVWNSKLDLVGWPRNGRSVDTNKMVKWGLKNKRLNALDSLRGAGPLDFKTEMDLSQRLDTIYNTAYIRKFLV